MTLNPKPRNRVTGGSGGLKRHTEGKRRGSEEVERRWGVGTLEEEKRKQRGDRHSQLCRRLLTSLYAGS